MSENVDLAADLLNAAKALLEKATSQYTATTKIKRPYIPPLIQTVKSLYGMSEMAKYEKLCSGWLEETAPRDLVVKSMTLEATVLELMAESLRAISYELSIKNPSIEIMAKNSIVEARCRDSLVQISKIQGEISKIAPVQASLRAAMFFSLVAPSIWRHEEKAASAKIMDVGENAQGRFIEHTEKHSIERPALATYGITVNAPIKMSIHPQPNND